MAKYKYIFTILFALSCNMSFGQYTPMTAFGYIMKRVEVDSTLHIPSFCGVPTLRNSQVKNGALALDTCNNLLYKYTRAAGWSAITSIDTTSLSNRINQKLSISDTLAMLAPYAKTSQLATKLNVSDTSAMLAPYLEAIDTANKWVNNISRTIGNDSIFFWIGSTKYAIKDSTGGTTIDTTSLSNRINQKLSISDTLAMLAPYAKTSQLATKLNISDTTNKWVSFVTKLNDSTIQVIKGTTTTNITLSSSTTVTNATRLVTTVYNKTGSTIAKGSVVYIDGKHSNNLPSIALAMANNESNSYKTFAIVADDITNMNSGLVIQVGSLTGLNLPTNQYTDGDLIYLSPTVAGGYTTTKPLAPNHIVKLGTVVNAHPTQGSIEIKIENGWQLDELSDVKIAAVPNDSTLLQFSRVDSLWHDVSVANAIGNKYINPSDTANMLANYAKTSAVNLKVNISDTANMLNKYLRKTDTATLSARIDLKQNQLNGTGFVKASGTTISYDNSTYLLASSYQYMLNEAYQALGSTIKGFNLAVPTITNATTSLALTSQQMRVVAYYLPQAATITGVKYYSVTGGVYTGNNYNGVGLYSYSGGTLTLVASTTNDANFWTPTQGWVTKPFSTTYSAAAGIYYIGFIYSTSSTTTAPSIGVATAANSNGFQTVDFTNSAKIQGALSAQTSLPSSSTISSFGANTGNPLILLY